MSKRNRKPTKNSVVDICVLTAGVIDPHVFEKCLDAINREMQDVPAELYIFRNGMPEETRAAYKAIIDKYPAHVNQQSNNQGFPVGANRVIRAGTSPLVLFVSDDVILHKGALKTLLLRMFDPTIGLCGMKLLFPEDSTDRGRPAGRVQHIGHGIDIRGEIVHPLLGWRPENPKCNVSRETLSVTGAAFMVRRKVFQQAGGFFEGYGAGYFEDVDLCLTIRQLEHKVFIDTNAVGTHYTGATFIKQNQPMPLETNKLILRQRKSAMFQHDNWTFY